MSDAPPATPGVSCREFERMIDDSLHVADNVRADETVKGELWLMRDCRWFYVPYRFRVVYHVFAGELQVVCFQAQRAGCRWRVVRNTDEYGRLIREADVWRRAQP